MQNKNLLGIILVFIYCVTSSLSLVIVSSYEQHFDPVKLAFYTFLVAVLFFNFISIGRLKENCRLAWRHKKIIVALNIATVVAWIPVFYSLKYIAPVIVLGIIFGVIPVAVVLLSLKQGGLKLIAKADIFFAGMLALVVACIIAVYLNSIVSESSLMRLHAYIALSFAMAVGIGTACCLGYMKSLSSAGFSTIQIMSIRFYLLLLVAAITVGGSHLSFVITRVEFYEILLLAALTVVIPIFFLQKGLEFTSPVNVSFIVPLQLVITYGIQTVEARVRLPLLLVVLLGALTSIILVSAYYKSRRIYAKH